MTEEEMKQQEEAAQAAAAAQEAGGEAAPAETQEPEETPSAALRRRMSEAYPDDNYDEDPEALSRRVLSHLEEIEGDRNMMKGFMDQLTARAQESPAQAAALIDWAEGMDWPAAIRKNMGDDALTMQEGMEGWDAYQEAGKKRDEEFKKNREMAQSIFDNANASEAAFKEFCEEAGLSEEQGQALWERVQADITDLANGKVSKDVLKRYQRDNTYDADIAAAIEQGRQEGADEKLALERKRMKGSGLPAGGSGNGNADTEPKEEENPTVKLLRGISRYR